MESFLSNDALTRLKNRQKQLRAKLEEADRRGDFTEYISLENKYRSITIAISNMIGNNRPLKAR